jgi:hypothetical protein
MSDEPPFASPITLNMTGRGGFTVELSQTDFDALLLALGMAAGACLRDGQKGLALLVIELSNKINKNNPRWIPYETAPAPPTAENPVEPLNPK